jgi:CDP-glucose 4,6-dehydratase
VLQIVDHIRAQMRSDLAPEVLNEPVKEIREQHLDASKAQRRLGWRPRFGLDDGLARTIGWYRNYLLGAS